MLTLKQLENAVYYNSNHCLCYGGIHTDADGFCKNEDVVFIFSKRHYKKAWDTIYSLCSKCIKECRVPKEIHVLTEKEAFTFKVIHGL